MRWLLSPLCLLSRCYLSPFVWFLSLCLSLSAMRRLSFSCLRLVFSLCVFLPFSCLSALIRLSFSILLCLLSLSLSSTFPNHPFPHLLKTTTPSFRIHPDLSFSLSLSPAGTCGHTDMCSSLTTRCHHRPGPWMAPPPICTLGCPLENGSTRSSLSAHFRSRLRAWTSPCIVQRDAVLGVNWRWSFFIVLFHVLFVLSFFYSFPPVFVVVSFIFFFLRFFHFFLL